MVFATAAVAFARRARRVGFNTLTTKMAKKGFYKGWASFVRSAYSNNATFTFLKNTEENPVGLYF